MPYPFRQYTAQPDATGYSTQSYSNPLEQVAFGLSPLGALFGAAQGAGEIADQAGEAAASYGRPMHMGDYMRQDPRPMRTAEDQLMTLAMVLPWMAKSPLRGQTFRSTNLTKAGIKVNSPEWKALKAVQEQIMEKGNPLTRGNLTREVVRATPVDAEKYLAQALAGGKVNQGKNERALAALFQNAFQAQDPLRINADDMARAAAADAMKGGRFWDNIRRAAQNPKAELVHYRVPIKATAARNARTEIMHDIVYPREKIDLSGFRPGKSGPLGGSSGPKTTLQAPPPPFIGPRQPAVVHTRESVPGTPKGFDYRQINEFPQQYRNPMLQALKNMEKQGKSPQEMADWFHGTFGQSPKSELDAYLAQHPIGEPGIPPEGIARIERDMLDQLMKMWQAPAGWADKYK